MRQEKKMNNAIQDPHSNIDNWTGPSHQLQQMFRALSLQREHPAQSADTESPISTDLPDQQLSYRSLRKGRAKAVWNRASILEFGRLAQGMPGLVAGTDTMHFIHHHMKPSDRIASYCRFVCAYNALKTE